MNTGLHASKKVVHKAGEFIGSKTVDAVTKSNDDNTEKQEPIEEIIIPLEKREEIVNKLRKVLLKCSTINIRFNCIQICDKKWVEVNNLSSGKYSINKSKRFEASMLRSDLCDYSDAYIVAKGIISVTGTHRANRRNKKLILKNNAPFRSCITKINNTFEDNAEDLDIVMPMYNLVDYSDNYAMTSGSLRNYYKDEINDGENENDDNGNKIRSNKTTRSKSFKYKTKIKGSTPNNASRLNTEVVVPLKYLSNF